MLDTIALSSPEISEELAEAFEEECLRRSAVQMKTGEVLYELMTGSLLGSYDHRLCFRVDRTRWQPQIKAPPIRVPCPPYLYFEGSIHKALLGHNISGGSIDFSASAHWLLDKLSTLVQLPLPPLSGWKVHRVDWAECYQMPSFESCSEYFMGLNASHYPRRSVNRYGNSGLYAPGSTTATKFYHKGVEFSKHDRARLRNLIKPEQLNELQHFANTVIRVEVEVKADKLKYDFAGELPRADQITQEYLQKVFDIEVNRILREGQKEMEIVREARLVEARLYQVYKPALAGVLLGTWFRFSTLGEDAVKKALSKRTFYRQRKQLVEAGCDWHQTDVRLLESTLIPQGFSLRRGSQWHLSDQDPKVVEQLAPYIAA